MGQPITHGGKPNRIAATPEMIGALLEIAGLAGDWVVDSLPPVGWVNSTTIIRLASGERFVVRQYGWPFSEEQLFDRRAKEQWLHPRLAAAGISVPDILASADVADDRGVLMSWLPGELLGVVATREAPADDVSGAWRQAAAALRAAHSIPLRSTDAGFLSADGLVALPEGSFGQFHQDRIGRYARRLHAKAPELGVDPVRITALARAAQPKIDEAPLVLGHGDSHAWNVLVVRDQSGRWQLSGWLDWEFAWAGDPAWDHMRMMVQRFSDFGALPNAWWDGYGSRPRELNLAIAVLHFMLWKALDHVAGIDSRDAAVALAWLIELPQHLAELEQLLANS